MEEIEIVIVGAIFLLVIAFAKGNKKKPSKRSKPPVYKKPITPKPIKQPVSLDPIVGGCWVIDGDTIHIGSNKIRFQGINAPELDEPYGKQAKWALHKLVKGQTIRAIPNGEKSYDRIVAKCFLEDGTDLAAEMVKLGFALDLPNYPDADYKHLETPASRKKLSWKPRKKKETKND